MASLERSGRPAGSNGASRDSDANAVRPTRERTRRARAEREAEDASAGTRRSAPTEGAPENSIRPSKPAKKEQEAQERREEERAKQRAAAANATPSVPARRDTKTIPESVQARFTKVGRDYFFNDGTRAFTDRGRALTTPSENTEVVKSLIDIAQARGWEQITVSGSERFRKEAWTAGRLAGLAVRGYEASAFEQQRLVQLLIRQTRNALAMESGAAALPRKQPAPRESPATRAAAARSASPSASRSPPAGAAAPVPPPAESPRADALLTGRLLDHGTATYRHDPREPVSYFVRLDTARGEREIWGVDLQRAFKESLTGPQVGDEVGLRVMGREKVNVKWGEHDAQGKPVDPKNAYRNRWIVEKQAFFAERSDAARTVRDASIEPARAVARHPELAGTYANLRAAELTAQQLRDPEDRRTFVATVRTALASAIERGEPLPPVRLREQPAERQRSGDRERSGDRARSAEREAARSRNAPARESAPVRG